MEIARFGIHGMVFWFGLLVMPRERDLDAAG
jgi:hypothetical protein